MAETRSGAAGGYVAFISYSHKDAAVGRWLHRRLEGYRLPKRLAGTQGEDGEVPARLTPIFRDRDELPAAGDLSEKVRAALAVSRNLIVVCSPHSAASPWVAKEIATFRELHPDRPVFTAIVEGEPVTCFSPALREGGVEPLAADLRKEGDGRRLGLLKLVAGLAGVGLDALVQRDAARRVRRVTYVTAAAVAAMLLMALLTAFALNARAEAQRQRSEAEGLVEFMLTDLRTKVKGVGRLDALRIVNERALAFYQRQGVEDLPAESLERRARILHAMVEDDLAAGNDRKALAELREVARTTEKLLAEDPDDAERIFAHAQSEFWIGYVHYDRGNFARALPPFQRYSALAERLVAMDSHNPQWMKEAGYALGNLCTIALTKPGGGKVALERCTKALARMELAARLSGDRIAFEKDLANRHAWLADAYLEVGDAERALAHRREQEELLVRLIARDPENFGLREIDVTCQMAIAGLEAKKGAVAAAKSRLNKAAAQIRSLTVRDEGNALWKRRLRDVQKKLSELSTS